MKNAFFALFLATAMTSLPVQAAELGSTQHAVKALVFMIGSFVIYTQAILPFGAIIDKAFKLNQQ